MIDQPKQIKTTEEVSVLQSFLFKKRNICNLIQRDEKKKAIIKGMSPDLHEFKNVNVPTNMNIYI